MQEDTAEAFAQRELLTRLHKYGDQDFKLGLTREQMLSATAANLKFLGRAEGDISPGAIYRFLYTAHPRMTFSVWIRPDCSTTLSWS